jgi:MtaA/CmuA family methyltransferase
MADHLILDAIKGRETARVPVAPLITLPHASKIFGIKPSDYILDSEKYAKAQIYARKFYDYDWVFAHQIFQGLTSEERSGVKNHGDYLVLLLELGTKLKIQESASPFIIEKAVKNKEEIDELKVPDTFHPDRLRPIKIMRDSEEIVFGNIRCPFTFAATYLYDAESFFMDLKRDEGFVKKLLEFALKYCIESGDAQIEAGVDAMFIEDPSASPNVISPETFRKIVLPFERRLVKSLRKKVPVVFHICGDTSPILEDMIGTGADCISVDECMDIEEVHKKTPVWGNVAPKLLVKEKPEKIREISEDIVEIGQGLVLSSGCVVPGIAKPDNISEMVKVAHGN